jgi:uncharacterized protein (TIGR02246 family)
MKRLTYLFVLVLLVAMASMTWAGADEEIAKVRGQYVQAWNGGDVEAISALFTDNAQFFPSTTPFLIEDKQAIKALYAGFFSAFPTRSLIIRQSSVRLFGDTTAADNGYFQATLGDAKGPSRTIFGRYSTMYVKQAGKWMIVNLHASALPVSP